MQVTFWMRTFGTALLLLDVRAACFSSRGDLGQPCLARVGKVCDTLLEASGNAAAPRFDVAADFFDIRRAGTERFHRHPIAPSRPTRKGMIKQRRSTRFSAFDFLLSRAQGRTLQNIYPKGLYVKADPRCKGYRGAEASKHDAQTAAA